MCKAQRWEAPPGLLWQTLYLAVGCVRVRLVGGAGGMCCEGQVDSQEGFVQNDLMKAECYKGLAADDAGGGGGTGPGEPPFLPPQLRECEKNRQIGARYYF